MLKWKIITKAVNCTAIFISTIYKQPMYNYHNYVSSTDRFGSEGTVEYQLQLLAKKLRVPLESVLLAVQEVGFDIEEIEEYIRDRYNRSL